MVEQSLPETVLTMIRAEANNNPAPVSCTVKQVYTGYVDIVLDDGTVIRSVRCLGDAVKGSDAVLVFLDGDYSNMLVVPPSSAGEGVTVDSSLSSTSVNPVQNKVINTALGGKVDKETGKGLFSGVYSDLTGKPDIPEAYVHPSSKQCDYEYVHPSTQQCNAEIPTLTPTQVYTCNSFNTTYINTTGATNLLSLYKLGSLYLLRYFITTKTLTNHETEYLMNNDEIASQYRPGSDVTFHVATSSNHNAKIRINTNGQIRISTDTDNTAISLAGTCIYWW